MDNPFYVAPLGGLSAYANIGNQIGGAIEKNRQQEQLAQARQAVAEAFESGDVNAIRQAMIQYPEMADQTKNAFGFTNGQTERVARETYRRVLSDPENAPAYMQQGIQQVAEFGGRPEMMTRDLQMLQENPKAALQNIRSGYASLASDQEFESMFGGQDGPNIGQYNPRDYTTESFAEFVRSGDPSVLERYAPQRSVDIGGVPHVFDPAIGGYRPAGVAGAGGAQPVTAETVGESEAEIAARRTRAQEQARQDVESQSPQERRQSAEARRLAEQNISNFQGIVAQAESLLNNEDYLDAMSGISGRVPAVPGTDRYDAQIAFNQFKDTLTLGNLDKMSGVLTDRDIQVLASAAGGIEAGMSRGALESRLKTIRNIFASKSDAEQRKLREFMGQPASVSEQDSEENRSTTRIRLDAQGNIIQ